MCSHGGVEKGLPSIFPDRKVRNRVPGQTQSVTTILLGTGSQDHFVDV